ncbi:MAG: PEPxxWA-CTERM sorting domain-containing protein [Piscinibacter sp.]|nr:PEPxxWA-CTERM sorting domain-containing protein [Piscinibacter sp.]
MRASPALAILVCAAGIASTPAAALTLGQIDTFSGSLQGWSAGGAPPFPPVLVKDGGPGGAGDSYMLVTSTGSQSAGGKMVVLNDLQWAGNYTAAGITTIELDLRNLGTTDLVMRLYFEDPAGGAPKNQAITTQGFALAAGSGWTHVSFAIRASDLTTLTGSAAELLTNTTVLRLYHGPQLSFPGNPIAAKLGVDNVAAVPEPTSWALMIAGLGLIGALTRRSTGRADRRVAPAR